MYKHTFEGDEKKGAKYPKSSISASYLQMEIPTPSYLGYLLFQVIWKVRCVREKLKNRDPSL